ncbi:MAG: methyltransferase domain-containing protein [Vicinamibacterales bacterium]
MTATRALAGLVAAAAVSFAAVPGTRAAGQTAAPARAPDIYFTPTAQTVAEAMLALGGVGPGDVVYDLGSGDGRLVVLAAQQHGARGVGIEIQPHLVERSRQIAADGGVADRVRFVEGDLYTADVSEATVVLLYLSVGITREITPKLRRELRPGARIVSHQFRLADWPPDRTARVEGEEIFLWTVPAPAADQGSTRSR